MVDYLVRVEIYDASYKEYAELHERMLRLGFYRCITSSDGKSHSLPDGTYFGISDWEKTTILSRVMNASKPLSKREPSVFVGVLADWTASLY
ncbi:type V toxin-antitoxin system endoribonuclease antitoxin GhoS [Xenorhabdus stockiae]|uniref:type V toxin-antitoxin system endoribonuclease antitoxin GhoS n=1 Tax=Xenorhabdus stockiae TaxID=351614 RepID=UPI003CF2E907